MTNRTKPYPRDLRERAVRLVLETTDQYPSRDAAIKSIAAKLGIGTAQTLRNWVRQAEVDAGARPGISTDEAARIKRLERENAELKRANEILKAAASFFAAELDPAFHR
jgi:transposase